MSQIGLPVPGYQPQSDDNINRVTRMKRLEEKVLRALDDLGGLHRETPAAVDFRWLAIARTQIEQGFMAANRSVFQPARLLGDMD